MAMTTIAMTDTMGSVENRIRAILLRVAKLDGAYGAHADLYQELGVKSVAAIDLLLTLEEEFGVRISDEEFSQARTLSALAGLVQGAGR
jgi:acyl carrier protein